ncbi:unnamed protein product, partial [Closterium sp. NIES-64]
CAPPVAPPLPCLLSLPSRTLYCAFPISLSLPPPPLPAPRSSRPSPPCPPRPPIPSLPGEPKARGGQQARGAPGRAAGQQRRPHQRSRPSQAKGRASGEQQARGVPGRAAGARAAGQQRRPHQRSASSTVDVRPFYPCSPCPLSTEAPPPPAPHNQLTLCVLIAGDGEGCGVNTDAPSRPSPVAVQVAAVGGEGGSTPLGWDGMGEESIGMGSSGTSVAAGQHGGSRRAAAGQQVAHTGVALAGDMECTRSTCSPPNPPTAKYPRSSPILPTLPRAVAFHTPFFAEAAPVAPFPAVTPPQPNHVHPSHCYPYPLTHFPSVLSLQVERRGVGVNTATPPHPSPCGRAGGSGGRGGGQHSTRLGWNGRVSGWGRLEQAPCLDHRGVLPPLPPPPNNPPSFPAASASWRSARLR